MDKVDCLVIGAGVVGLAEAAALTKRGREVVVFPQHMLWHEGFFAGHKTRVARDLCRLR